jgi:hypothetical protein
MKPQHWCRALQSKRHLPNRCLVLSVAADIEQPRYSWRRACRGRNGRLTASWGRSRPVNKANLARPRRFVEITVPIKALCESVNPWPFFLIRENNDKFTHQTMPRVCWSCAKTTRLNISVWELLFYSENNEGESGPRQVSGRCRSSCTPLNLVFISSIVKGSAPAPCSRTCWQHLSLIRGPLFLLGDLTSWKFPKLLTSVIWIFVSQEQHCHQRVASIRKLTLTTLTTASYRQERQTSILPSRVMLDVAWDINDKKSLDSPFHCSNWQIIIMFDFWDSIAPSLHPCLSLCFWGRPIIATEASVHRARHAEGCFFLASFLAWWTWRHQRDPQTDIFCSLFFLHFARALQSSQNVRYVLFLYWTYQNRSLTPSTYTCSNFAAWSPLWAASNDLRAALNCSSWLANSPKRAVAQTPRKAIRPGTSRTLLPRTGVLSHSCTQSDNGHQTTVPTNLWRNALLSFLLLF